MWRRWGLDSMKPDYETDAARMFGPDVWDVTPLAVRRYLVYTVTRLMACSDDLRRERLKALEPVEVAA